MGGPPERGPAEHGPPEGGLWSAGPWRVGKWLGRGRCLAENESSGRCLAVGGTLPNERVFVDVERTRWKTWGNAVAVVDAAPERVAPRCPHVGNCPGCVMLHVDEQTEDHYKATVVSEVFRRILGEAGLDLDVPAPNAVRIVAPTRRGGQRVRAALAWCIVDGRCEVGLRRFDGRIVHAPECDANAPRLRSLATAFAACWPSALGADHAEGTLELVAGSHDQVTVWLSQPQVNSMADAHEPALASEPSEAERVLQRLYARLPPTACVELVSGDPRKPHERRTLARIGDDPVPAPVAGITLSSSALGWTQPTPAQAERVYDWVVDTLDASGQHTLDVGSATGGLSLAIGREAASVLGIDVDYRAVQAATASAALHAAAHVIFRGGKAETVLPKLAQATATGHYTRALINPFRSPLGEDAMSALVTLGVDRVVYLAPSPTSGAKDAVHLLRAGFRIESLGVASLHPGTAQGMACVVLSLASRDRA
ncbi:MAG: 23S rRNA (uracil1939-C5)-methyltransferase [Bradymonadia bacterium]|jgi:23S rRNA (uracil1939-C5)-methyltransferase